MLNVFETCNSPSVPHVLPPPITAEKSNPEYIDEEAILALFRTDLLIAGIETTSTVQQWVVTMLLGHPRVHAKVVAELRAAAEPDQPIYMETIAERMPYLRAVVKETFRLRHPLPLGIPRTPLADYAITDEYLVPKGVMILPVFDAFYRNPALYPDPDTFLPERFMPGGSNAAFGVDIGSSAPDGDVIPFGAGGRMCVGYRLAKMEIYLTLANFLHAFTMELHPDHPFSTDVTLVVVSSPSIRPEPAIIPRPQTIAVFEDMVEAAAAVRTRGRKAEEDQEEEEEGKAAAAKVVKEAEEKEMPQLAVDEVVIEGVTPPTRLSFASARRRTTPGQ